MIDLTGKVALVTGGSRGLGRAIALRLAAAGADIVVNFLNTQAGADQTAEQIAALGRRVAEVKADVSEPEDIQTMLDWVGANFGRLDVVVASAGTHEFGSLLETSPERFQTAMNTNVRSLVLLVQAALPLLQNADGRAKVVALSSGVSNVALPQTGLWGAGKAALESLVRHLALEVGPRGVNVNAVQSGLVDTDALRAAPEGARLLSSQSARQLTGDRALTPEAVADAVLFLASPLSDLIQGQTLVVDGGAAVRV